MDFFQMIGDQIFHIPVIGSAIIGLFVCFFIIWMVSFFSRYALMMVKFAPSVLTAAGLMGTFVGLTMGLKDLNLSDQQSMQALIDGLKSVFIYSLVGVATAIFFMLANMIPSVIQRRWYEQEIQGQKQKVKKYNDQLLGLQRAQLEEQKKSAAAIEKLQFDNDNEALGRIISQAVVTGLTPVLLEIKHAVADQGGEAIRQVLDELKQEILVPMQKALHQTNHALGDTNQAVMAIIKAVQDSQAHSDRLIEAVGQASEQMRQASIDMRGLVGTIDQTVQHMHDVQRDQQKSLDQFNVDLQTNLSQIKPAIEQGLATAKDSLTQAVGSAALLMQQGIEGASRAMQDNIRHTLGEVGDKLNQTVEIAFNRFDDAQTKFDGTLNRFSTDMNGHLDRMVTDLESVGSHTKTVIDHASAEMVKNLNTAGESISQITGAAFKQFSTAQEHFDTTLNRFSTDMNGHLDRMATELESIGQNAKSLIDRSAENLASTLGDIDQKLLNTAVVLKESLEAFRAEYEVSLTQYLDVQQQRLDGFLDKQNEQLEQTIGRQRQGLEDVTQQLKQQFEQMVKQQDQLNKMYSNHVQRLDGIQQAVLPKIANIAHDLVAGERQFAQRIDYAGEHLEKINQVLSDIPSEIQKSYEKLNEKYIGAFNQLDGGIHDVASKLVAASDVLMQSIRVHQIFNESE